MKNKLLIYFKILVFIEAIISFSILMLIESKNLFSLELFYIFIILAFPIFFINLLLRRIDLKDEKDKKIKEYLREKNRKNQNNNKSKRIFNKNNTIYSEEDLIKWRKDFFNSKNQVINLPDELVILGFKIEEIELINKKEIKKRYIRLAQKYHPDKEYGNEESMKKINSAYKKAKETYKV